MRPTAWNVSPKPPLSLFRVLEQFADTIGGPRVHAAPFGFLPAAVNNTNHVSVCVEHRTSARTARGPRVDLQRLFDHLADDAHRERRLDARAAHRQISAEWK